MNLDTASAALTLRYLLDHPRVAELLSRVVGLAG